MTSAFVPASDRRHVHFLCLSGLLPQATVWQITAKMFLVAPGYLFPKLQFIATTHSPVVLATLLPEEVVRLQADPSTGHVRRITPDSETEEWDPIDKVADLYTQPDPRTMTGTEMYKEYFGMDRLTLNEHGEKLRVYTALATNPHRTKYQQERMSRLQQELIDAFVTDLVNPVSIDSSNDPAKSWK